MTHYSKIILTVLNDQVLSYLPKDKPAQPDAGKQAIISKKAQKLIGKYNYVINELCTSDEWVENRAHIDGRNKVYDGKYQLSASCAYVFDTNPKTFTLQLILDDKTYEPTQLQIVVKNPLLTEMLLGRPFSIYIPLNLLERDPPKEIISAINTLTKATLEQVETLTSGRSDIKNNIPVNVAGFKARMESLKSEVLPPSATGARDTEIIGVSLDTDLPTLYISYKTDDGTGVTAVPASTQMPK